MSLFASNFTIEEIGEQLVHQIPWGTILTLNEIRQQPVAQIPWESIIQIMTSSKSHEEIPIYLAKRLNEE